MVVFLALEISKATVVVVVVVVVVVLGGGSGSWTVDEIGRAHV